MHLRGLRNCLDGPARSRATSRRNSRTGRAGWNSTYSGAVTSSPGTLVSLAHEAGVPLISGRRDLARRQGDQRDPDPGGPGGLLDLLPGGVQRGHARIALIRQERTRMVNVTTLSAWLIPARAPAGSACYRCRRWPGGPLMAFGPAARGPRSARAGRRAPWSPPGSPTAQARPRRRPQCCPPGPPGPARPRGWRSGWPTALGEPAIVMADMIATAASARLDLMIMLYASHSRASGLHRRPRRAIRPLPRCQGRIPLVTISKRRPSISETGNQHLLVGSAQSDDQVELTALS